MNERVVKNPNFNSLREFHESLLSQGAGAKDYPNSHTEVEHLGGGKFAASIGIGHKVFFDKADGNKPKKHKLTDERPAKDYVLVQGAKCCTEVHPYYTKYFDVQHEEVRLHEERWVVQRLFKEPDMWRDVDAYNPQIAVEEYPEPAGDVVKVTVTYDTDYGTLTVEYFQRDNNNLKHNVTFRNTSGSTQTFRVLQRWAGIVADRVDGDVITAPTERFNYSFSFEKAGRLQLKENLSSFIPTWQEEVEAAKKVWIRHGECNRCGKCCGGCSHYIEEYPRCTIYETRPDYCKEFPWEPDQIKNIPECTYSFEATGIIAYPTKLKPTILDTHPQGLKADFVYGEWVLAPNVSLVIDPNTATLNNPTEDGVLAKIGASAEVCSTAAPSRAIIDPTNYYGSSYSKSTYNGRRAYVEWDISSIPDGSTITDSVFKYEGVVSSATDGEINPITEEAPSGATDANLWTYCGSGTAYVNPFSVVVGINQSQDLGAAADTDLAAALAADWFAIGFTNEANECTLLNDFDSFYSEDKDPAPTPKPTLYVEYTPPGGGIGDKSALMAAKMLAGKMI